MGRKTSAPKPEEYSAEKMEKVVSSIAKADSDYHDVHYAPLLKERRDDAARKDLVGFAQGRAGADAMQYGTGNLDLGTVSGNITQGADLASGAIKNMVGATIGGLQTKRDMQTDVLAGGRGQEQGTGAAMSHLARISNTEALNAMQNKQSLRRARRQALFNVGVAAGGSDPVQNVLGNYGFKGSTTEVQG